MKNADQIVRLLFSAVAAAVSGGFGFGYHWVHYHNEVEHHHTLLPSFTNLVAGVAPWVFLVPLTILIAGLIWRRRPLVLLCLINVGWLFAVAWPPLCLWVWEIPNTLI